MQRSTGQSSGAVTFGVMPILLWLFSLFIESWVALASIGLLTLGVTAAASNYLAVSILYFLFPGVGMVIFILVFLFGGVKFSKNVTSVHLAFGLPILLAIALIFGLTSLISIVGTSTAFKLFSSTYSAASGNLASFITNPVFYTSWITSNAIGEEMIFLPAYLLIIVIFGSKWYVQVAANISFGGIFMIFHLIKILLIYGTVTQPAQIFLASAFAVRIMLNLMTFYSRSVLPAMIAHPFYDIVTSVLWGAN